ncbi:MAG: hypothetical protein WC717_00255 [Candidatus Micrarchaeia archaeon]
MVASVFLLVLVSSAARIAKSAPDHSYQPIVAMHLQEHAMLAAFSDALSEAAGKALAASQASGAEAPALAKAAAYLAAVDFEAQARGAGYDVVFWCGKPGEAALQDASGKMADDRSAALPDGALALANPACADSFDVNLLRKKVLVRNAGFSIYSKWAGAGHALQLPDGLEGGMDG